MVFGALVSKKTMGAQVIKRMTICFFSNKAPSKSAEDDEFLAKFVNIQVVCAAFWRNVGTSFFA